VIVVANAKPDNAITEIVLQESCRFRSIGHLSILLIPSVPFFSSNKAKNWVRKCG
jgi:hypothetical protein